jgi:hypothetical protein
MRSKAFFFLAAAGLIALAIPMSGAHAGSILVFGQSGTTNEFTATNTGSPGAAGGTVLSAVDIPITITGIAGSATMPAGFPEAYFNLSASSVTNAELYQGNIVQDFSGTFSITSFAGGGTNYLSGSFNDAVFGAGAALGLTSSGTAVPTFSSAVISALDDLRGISLSFSNVTPPAYIANEQTLGGFTSNVSGNFSAANLPEPSSLILFGIGSMALLLVVLGRRLRKRVAAA